MNLTTNARRILNALAEPEHRLVLDTAEKIRQTERAGEITAGHMVSAINRIKHAEEAMGRARKTSFFIKNARQNG